MLLHNDVLPLSLVLVLALKAFSALTDTGKSILMLHRRSGRSLSHGNVTSGFCDVPDGQLEL